MSHKSLGMTCVLDEEGRLTGVITDGDLRRQLMTTNNLRDRVASARSVSVASRLHVHPDCEIADLTAQTARIRAAAGDCHVAFAGRGRLGVERSIYCPEFGVAIENRALVYRCAGADIEMGFCISDESLEDARSLSDPLLPS